MTRIAHLSDLHFGRTDHRALDLLRDSVNGAQPDIVVVTGDLTQSGRRREFRAAADFFASLDAEVFAIPGNHDTPVYNLAARFLTPWARFRRYIGEDRRWESDRVAVLGVNSARRAAPRLNWSYGKLREAHIRAVAEEAARLGDKLVFIAVHHPFLTGPGRAGAETVGRADKAIAQFSAAGVAGVLTGHVHVTSIAPIPGSQNRLLSIQAGTAASTRQRSESASYLLLDVDAEANLQITPYTDAGDAFAPKTTRRFARENGVWREAA